MFIYTWHLAQAESFHLFIWIYNFVFPAISALTDYLGSPMPFQGKIKQVSHDLKLILLWKENLYN